MRDLYLYDPKLKRSGTFLLDDHRWRKRDAYPVDGAVTGWRRGAPRCSGSGVISAFYERSEDTLPSPGTGVRMRRNSKRPPTSATDSVVTANTSSAKATEVVGDTS